MARKGSKSDIEYNGDFTNFIKNSLQHEFGSEGMVAQTMEERWENGKDTNYLSTGDDILDLSISNVPNGGVLFGRYLNIYSDSGLGKSLLVFKMIANVQKLGGTAVLFDTEGGSFKKFAEVLGVDVSKVVYFEEYNTVEKIFEIITAIILSNKEAGIDSPLLIAVDSMTAVTTKKGADLSEFESQGYGVGAEKQKQLGDMFKKLITKIKQDNVIFITTDQIRDKINASPWERAWRDTAGWAQKFYSDIRLELTPRGVIKNKDKEVIGYKVNIKTVKNRIAPSPRNTTHFIYGTRGLDNLKSWIENGKDLNILQKSRKLKYIMPNGEEFRRESDGNLPTEMEFKRELKQNKELREMLYKDFCDRMIIEYEFDDETVIDDDDNIVEDIEGNEDDN